ncbi:MAG: type VI secretion protein [Burkholderiales bacterium]|nr:MAG: type VI secretion protein [Burkholderiales bacterium]
MIRTSTLGPAILVLALAGCSTIGDIGRSVGIGGASPAQQKLADGVALYDKGDFASAIRTLQSTEIAEGDVETRVRANKYLAFSYCVTQRRALCRRSFDTALRLDDAFELEPVEAGHPVWGPVYAQARKAAGQRRDRR